MVSSKDQAKKISQDFRQLSKKFFEDFYAKAEAASRFPLPLEAAVAFGRILDQAAKEYEGPPPDHTGVSVEVFGLVSSKFPQQGYREAVEAWFRHTPGLEIKKGKSGRKAEGELAERIWKLKAEGRTVHQMQAIFKAEGQHFSREKIESYLKTRRKLLK